MVQYVEIRLEITVSPSSRAKAKLPGNDGIASVESVQKEFFVEGYKMPY
jgi:hypothetical protein